MPYAHRSVHDADGQTMEWPGWPSEYADSRTLERLVPLSPSAITPGGADVVEAFRSEHRNPTRRTRDGVEFISPRDWAATGSLIREDRPPVAYAFRKRGGCSQKLSLLSSLPSEFVRRQVHAIPIAQRTWAGSSGIVETRSANSLPAITVLKVAVSKVAVSKVSVSKVALESWARSPSAKASIVEKHDPPVEPQSVVWTTSRP